MLREFVYTLLIAVAAIIVNIYWEKPQTESVELKSVFGRLRGTTGYTRGGRTIYKFTSIPYAKPPLGELRFEPPVKYGKWKGTLDATKSPAACAQYDILLGKSEGQEDCLFLNVYTPNLPQTRGDKSLLPVMVFIHGGHFMYGNHRYYTPDYLLDEDVVLVTLHYRLNSLGFLNTGDSVVTGNQGLKDQTEALKWVKQAIADFGGNPSLVTLFGNSAGGASVGFHMMSNMSRGLFHRAISQSGSSLSPILFTRNPKRQAIRLGNKLGCPTKDSAELVACLKRLPVEDIIRIHEETYDPFCELDAIFAPSVERIAANAEQESKANDVFLSESPTKLLTEGKFHKIPWINGVAQDEGGFRTPLIINDKTKLHLMNHNWTSVIIEIMSLDSPQPAATAMKIRREYFPEVPKSSFPRSEDPIVPGRQIMKEDIRNISNLFGDRFFAESCSQESIYHSSHAPVYLYYLTKKPDIGYGYILDATRGILPARLGIIVAYLKALAYFKLGWTIDNYAGAVNTSLLGNSFLLMVAILLENIFASSKNIRCEEIPTYFVLHIEAYVFTKSRLKINCCTVKIVSSFERSVDLFYLYIGLKSTVSPVGVCHTDELPFLFKLSPELDISKTSPHFAFSESLVKAWISFAKNGKPDPFEGVEWVKAKNSEDAALRYLEIGDQPKMISEPFLSRLAFWRSLSLPQN